MTSVVNQQTLAAMAGIVLRRLQLPLASTIITNTDANVRLVWQMILATLQEISDDHPWPELQKETTFTLVTGQASYALPGDFDRVQNDTLWNRTQRWPLIGPLDPVLWQQYKSGLVTTLPRQRFRVKGWTDTQFFIDPTPTSAENGQTIAFEYISATTIRPKTWAANTVWTDLQYCSYNGNIYDRGSTGAATTGTTAPTWTSGTSSDGLINWTYVSAAYDAFVNDTDEAILNHQIVEQGAVWRFKRERGLDYETLRADAEQQLEVAKTKLSGAEIVSLNRNQVGPVGIGPWSYPEGNFNI